VFSEVRIDSKVAQKSTPTKQQNLQRSTALPGCNHTSVTDLGAIFQHKSMQRG
jgi:hypothetical protein